MLSPLSRGKQFTLYSQFVWPKIKPDRRVWPHHNICISFLLSPMPQPPLTNCYKIAGQACVVFNLFSISRGAWWKGGGEQLSSLFSFLAYSFIHSFIESVFNSRPVQNSFLLGAFHAIFVLYVLGVAIVFVVTVTVVVVVVVSVCIV